MSDPDETLRQAQLLTLEAIDLLGRRIDRLCHTVVNLPQKFAETVGANTAAVQGLTEAIEHERRDTAQAISGIKSELAALRKKAGVG